MSLAAGSQSKGQNRAKIKSIMFAISLPLFLYIKADLVWGLRQKTIAMGVEESSSSDRKTLPWEFRCQQIATEKQRTTINTDYLLSCLYA